MTPGTDRIPAVYCRGVSKTYVSGRMRSVALQGVELSIEAGELFMLVGPSGCGKTTLISVIAGILLQDEGECRVFGTDMKGLADGERTRRRGRDLGFVFQSFNLIPSLSAVENAAVPLMINGMSRRRACEQAAVLLERVGLQEKINALPAQLSGGQQQRVAIARALVHAPRLLVCDEPTSALDHRTGETVMELMRSVALAQGCTVVVVTHDARIFHHADRIARMDDGRIAALESAQSYIAKEK